MTQNNVNLRVVWLLPTVWFYWQPSLSKFTQLFPQTKIFTALWSGFAQGYENLLNIEIVGKQSFIKTSSTTINYGSGFTSLSPKIVAHLLQFKPQIIFTSSFGVWTILALLFKPLGRWRVVIAYEGSSPSVDYRHSLPRLTLRRFMVRSADICISNSQAGKDYLIEVLKASPDRVFSQPYEVPDLASLQTKTANKTSPSAKQTFLFLGSITRRKGVHLLLKACALLQEKGINNYQLIVVGDGCEKAELEAFTQHHNLGENVQWEGKVDYEKIGNYFQQADVFILPTLEDTWGMVILEAMLSGKAILCSQRAGAVEMVKEGETGYHFDPDDIAQLAALMQRFIDDPQLSITLGNQGQKLMEQYSPEVAAKFLAQIASLAMNSRQN